jgi:hypothetical protein
VFRGDQIVIRKRNEAGLKHEEIPLHHVIKGGTLTSLRAHDLSEYIGEDAAMFKVGDVYIGVES